MSLIEFIIEKILGFILIIAEKIVEACILGVFGLVDIVTSNDVSGKYTLILVVLFTSAVIVLINYFKENKDLFNIKKKRKRKRSKSSNTNKKSKSNSNKSNTKQTKLNKNVDKTATRKKAKR